MFAKLMEKDKAVPGLRGRDVRRVGGVQRAGTLTPHGLAQLGPLPGLTLSDRPEAVKQGLWEDPQQAPREG